MSISKELTVERLSHLISHTDMSKEIILYLPLIFDFTQPSLVRLVL
jgi:hypothetical protein